MQVTKQQPTNTMSTNLVTLNQTAQEIASALGTIDLELLQQVHALVTGGNKQDAAAAETETSAS